MKKRRWTLYLLLALFLAIILCLSFGDVCPLLGFVQPSIRIDKSTITDFILSLGMWAPAGSIGLMVLHSFFPFPAEILVIANGMAFGTYKGLVVTWFGAMLGAYASFGLTRLLGRPLIARTINPSHLEKIDRWMQKQGILALLLCRLMPLISFNLVNYAAGMMKISWWTFTWTTAIGILPVTILMVLMGNSFHMLPWWLWLLLLAFLTAAAYGVQFWQKNRRAE